MHELLHIRHEKIVVFKQKQSHVKRFVFVFSVSQKTTTHIPILWVRDWNPVLGLQDSSTVKSLRKTMESKWGGGGGGGVVRKK